MNRKMCLQDSDCDINYFCSFNKKDLKNYCIPNKASELYAGCLLDINKTQYIQENSPNKIKDMKNCIQFSRRQVNEDGLNYDYYVYRPQIDTFVDTTTINIYLKCKTLLIAVIPISFFKMECNDDNTDCILVSKPELNEFLKENMKTCNSNELTLEYDYQCDKENIRQSFKIPIEKKHIDKKIEIVLSCPINRKNDEFKSKCYALYLDNDLDNLVDSSIAEKDCENPVFRTPFIVNNISQYEELNKKNNQKTLEKFDDEIRKKHSELQILKAEKYIIDYKETTGDTISQEKALSEIEKKENLFGGKRSEPSWISLDNIDVVSFFLNDNQYSDYVSVYSDVVKTIEDAEKIALENNKTYFTWYHNNYSNQDYASKLFFISEFNDNNEPIGIPIFEKSHFKKDQNVTSGYYDKEGLIEKYDNGLDLYNLDQMIDIITIASLDATSINNNVDKLVENVNTKTDVNSGVLKMLDNKMMTYQQRVQMNDYENKINDQILNVIYVILFFVFVFSLILIIYLNQKYAGKVKLFGK